MLLRGILRGNLQRDRLSNVNNVYVPTPDAAGAIQRVSDA